jgi:GNAT superfamily N-acetyltransferase
MSTPPTPQGDEHAGATNTTITIRTDRDLPYDQVISLYESVGWSCARKPDLLHRAVLAAHSVVTAWDGVRLVALGYAISDGHLVVCYPHLVVAPAWQGRGIGSALMRRLMFRYREFHMQSLIADGRALDFYQKLGFRSAGKTSPLWIYDGDEH